MILPTARMPLFLSILLLIGTATAQEKALTGPQEDLVRVAVWGEPAARMAALEELRKLPATKERVRRVEEIIRAGRTYPAIQEAKQSFEVAIDGGRKLTVHVQLPKGYDPAKRYPLMAAMGGGPTPDDKRAKAQGAMMYNVWSKPALEAGWLVAAVEDTVSVIKTAKPLRYPMLGDDHFRAVLDVLFQRYAIDPNRVHATGISLGSNYATVYAAAHPDWFAGIAPVSTEGESREQVVRNLRHVGVFVLEGAKDKNIRTIDGPRKQAKILDAFGYRHRYDEEAERAHEAFVSKYPAVLTWLAEQPRTPFPKEVIRLAHPGIVLPARRFYWLETDTHQGCVEAVVKENTIEVQAARARQLTLHLSDRLLDLDKPVIVRVNGKTVHQQPVARSLVTAVEDAGLLNDSERCATARLTVAVPDLDAGERWLQSLAPKIEPAKLPFWEDFAVLTLQEARPKLREKLELEKGPLPAAPGCNSVRVTAVPDESPLRLDDRILEFDGEPFFANADSLAFLESYLWRTKGTALRLKVLRAGKQLEVTLPLK
jgi:poly(3-hydroxybutyrate) depolymerase